MNSDQSQFDHDADAYSQSIPLPGSLISDSVPFSAVEASLESEVEQLADALACRFEELTLIHGLTQRYTDSVKLSEDPSRVAESLLEELAPCIHCTTLAIHLFPSRNPEHDAPGNPMDLSHSSAEIIQQVGEAVSWKELLTIGDLAVDETIRRIGKANRAVLVNDLKTRTGEVLRVALIPIQHQSSQLGKIIAIRTMSQPEFGTTEADMMLSTSMMLAVHLVNQQQFRQLQGMYEGMIQSLASALDAKDSYTCGHSNRVADLSCELARKLGYSDQQVANLYRAGILHDIGKIGVDDSVLLKPGRLTDEEFAQIKLHPVIGYDILKDVPMFESILPAVRHHHEAWDGTGYPDGLAGDAIPRDAQIMAVADSFDAMTSDRPYRSGMPLEKVIGIFAEGRGKQWAADVVDALLQCEETMKRHAEQAKIVSSNR